MKKFMVMMGALVMLLAGCGEKEREHIDLSYLDENALGFLEKPREKGVYDNYAAIAKENRKKFVRWTATLKEIKYDNQIRLVETGLPEIRANFKSKVVNEYDLQVGDIVTVSCNLDNYNYVAWDAPRWWLKNCEIVTTSEAELEEVMAYKDKVDEQKNIAKYKKEKEQDEKEKANKIAEAKMEEELLKEKEYQQSEEGKIEFLTKLGEKKLAKSILDVRNVDNYWVIEAHDSSGIKKDWTRQDRLSRTTSFFKELFTESENYPVVLVIWNADLHDLKGNITVDAVMEIEMSSNNAESINWKSFSAENLPAVADEFWERNSVE